MRPNSAAGMAPGTRSVGEQADSVAVAAQGAKVPQDLKVQMKVIRKAEAMWNSDFQRLNVEKMARDRLTAKLLKAETLESDLIKAALEFEMDDTEFYTAQIRSAVENLCSNYDEFLVKIENRLGTASARGSQATIAEDANRRLHGARVNAHRDTMLH